MSIHTHRVSAQAWFALLGLALATWFIINNTTFLFKLGWIILGAFLLSLAIRPIADWLAQRRVSRGVTTLLLFVLGLGLLAFLGGLLIPVLQAETVDLRQRGPTLWQTVESGAMGPQIVHMVPSMQTVIDAASGQWNMVIATAIGTAAGLSSLLLDLLILLLLTYFLTVDTSWSSNLLLSWVPEPQQVRVSAMLLAISQRLTRWVWAQLVLSLVFALIFSLSLWLMQVPFALTIGLVSGVLTMIPYAGNLIGALLAMISALTIGITQAIWVLALVVVVTLVTNHLIAPYLYGKAMGLHSALALLALFVGAELGGIAGVLFAVPVAVIGAVILHEVQGTLLHLTPIDEQM